MKKQTIKYLFILLIGMQLVSCSKKEQLDPSQVPFLGGDNPAKIAEIDNWINENLTQPYNMQVKYKFDEFEANVNATLVPIKEELVLPSLKDIKSVWIDTYVAEGGETFMKTLIPKNITLIGSPSYNINGSITLGEAEGGLKILLYDMNRYDPAKNYGLFVQKMHTIEHEFGHILQQNKYYSPVFQTICVGDYTAIWTLVTTAEANALGFVTPYARSAPDEDFVETIATMLVEGKDYFEGIKAAQIKAGNQIAADKLTQKEQIIVAYYKDKWNIDFYSLQSRVKIAMQNAIPPAPAVPLATLLGFNNTYQALTFSPIANQESSAFTTAYNAAQANMTATNRSIQTVKLAFFAADSVVLSVGYLSGANPFTANYNFLSTRNAAGEVMIGNKAVTDATGATYGNGAARQPQLQPLLDYFISKTFTPKYFPKEPQGPGDNPLSGALYLTSDNASFVSGNLETTADYVH
ncbi:MAG: putative zinc-binding metallopeptidase [Ginsengibacter sp.]